MQNTAYTPAQLGLLVLLRIAIGWHFLYEGVVKILNPNWTSFSYLMDAAGPFKSFYNWIASTTGILWWVDLLNIVALTAIGLSLVTGCLSRWGAIGGISLLLLYYLSHIPYIGAQYMLPNEGNYLWIDKNIIEIAALAIVYVFPTSKIIGIDRWLTRCINCKKQK